MDQRVQRLHPRFKYALIFPSPFQCKSGADWSISKKGQKNMREKKLQKIIKKKKKKRRVTVPFCFPIFDLDLEIIDKQKLYIQKHYMYA